MVREIYVAGTVVEACGKILILCRKSGSFTGTWGLPAGMIEVGESDLDGARRELFEETGINVIAEDLEFIENFNWHFPNKTIIFPAYRLKLSNIVDIKIDPSEHSDFKWVTPEECYAMNNLIPGFPEFLKKDYLG